MKRLLSPATNLPGWMTLGFTLYAVIQAVANARAHHTAIGPAVIVAALAAGLAAYTRTQVTPVADPRVPGKVITDLVPGKPQLVLTAEEMAAIRRMLDTAFVVPVTPAISYSTRPPTPAPQGGITGPDFSGSPRMDYRGGTTTGPASPQPAAAPEPGQAS